MIISLENEGFLRNVLKIFTSRRDATFEVKNNWISISSYGQNNLYLSMEDTLFTIDGDDVIFTIGVSHLIRGLDILRGVTLVVEDDLKVINERSKIIIPFIPTIHHEYEEMDAPSTKFIVKSDMIEVFGLLKGLVTYEVEDMKLFIRRSGGEVCDEIEVMNIDFLMVGDLKFKCNNNWTETLVDIKEYVESIMFAFNEYFLCVQFLFNGYPRSYLEIQVPRSVVE